MKFSARHSLFLVRKNFSFPNACSKVCALLLVVFFNQNNLLARTTTTPTIDSDNACHTSLFVSGVEVDLPDFIERCNGNDVTLTPSVTNQPTCDDCEVIDTDYYDKYLDVWEEYNNNDEVCNDEFTGTWQDSYTDLVSFTDPIGNSNEKITSIEFEFCVVACDLSDHTDVNDIEVVNFAYSIELNGYQIGTFDPTELPCEDDQCEPNGSLTFEIDADELPYYYGGSNTLDLNFLSGPQNIAVANVGMRINTATYNCTTTDAISYLWSTGSTAPSITVSEAGIYSVNVTDCEGNTASDVVEVTQCCLIEADLPDVVERCNNIDVTLSPSVTNQSVCNDCVVIGTQTFSDNLDIWDEDHDICDDYFTSSYDSDYEDAVFFSDPIGNSNYVITAITIDFNVAACDLDKNYYESDVEALAFAYPIELNGYQIGTFDPTELPCSYDECDPNGTHTFTIDADQLPYVYGGTNSLDLNFQSGPQDICVANIDIDFHTTVYNCTEDDDSVDYLWNTGETSSSITVSEAGIYSVIITDCEGCTVTESVEVTQCCTIAADLGPDIEFCGSPIATLSPTVTNQSFCDNCILIGTNTHSEFIDVWEDVSSGLICDDQFTSSTHNNYQDAVFFMDPIGNENEVITSVTINFAVAACDIDANGGSVDVIDFDYPIELNGYLLGTFDPTELPCTFDVCDPNGEVTFPVDPDQLPYVYNDLNLLDLNFTLGAQAVCVANVTITFNTEVYTCTESDEVSYLWNNGFTTSTIFVTSPGVYSVTVTDCEGCEATSSIEVSEGEIITGLVFYNNGDDSCQTIDDTPAGDVTVNLYECDPVTMMPSAPGMGTLIESTLTQLDGTYEFVCETNGNAYYVEIEIPTNYVVIPQDDCGDDSIDSDGNADGQTIGCATGSNDFDFGLNQNIATISGSVTEDLDEDGIGDEAIPGVQISLGDSNGNPVTNLFGELVAPVITGVNGEYFFTDLLPGLYTVIEEQLITYLVGTEEDESDDDIIDQNDTEFSDNQIPVLLSFGEEDTDNNFIDVIDPCITWIQAEPNTNLSVGVVTAPGLIGTEDDVVNITFILVNTGEEPLSNLQLETEVLFFTGLPTDFILSPTFAGDPNNNGVMDPGEVWFYSSVRSFTYTLGDSFVITGGAMGDAPCGEEIGAGATILFTSGVNMDVDIEQECAMPGDVIDVTLTTRLLIDEDAAKNPGTATVIVSGVPIIVQLPATQWEARDLMLSATMLNGGVEFDPFDPPAGIELTNFCEQGGIDNGRNTNNVLDECETIETVREPCTGFGEDDTICEYPDWVFCYSITIPEDYLDTEFTVDATDDYSIWKAEESPAGSGIFNDFVDITDNVEAGGSDSETIEIKPIGVLPVELINFEAQKRNRTSILTWQTSSEINNSHFNIERSKAGGAYELIGQVTGNGSTVSENVYSFIDKTPEAGINYYRLVQYDFDGSFSRTDVRTVDFTYQAGSAIINVFPNPVVDFVTIETTVLLKKMTVMLFSIDGMKVVETEIAPGDQIDISQIPTGQYTLKAYDADRYEIGSQQLTVTR